MKGRLKCLDNEFITTRTGQIEMRGTFSKLPTNFVDFIFVYDLGQVTKSPGVLIACDLVEKIDNVYRIIDCNGRRFELEVLEDK